MKKIIKNSEQSFTKSDIVIVEGLKRITVLYIFWKIACLYNCDLKLTCFYLKLQSKTLYCMFNIIARSLQVPFPAHMLNVTGSSLTLYLFFFVIGVYPVSCIRSICESYQFDLRAVIKPMDKRREK